MKQNSLFHTHPEIAQWHPVKNGTLTPYDVVAGSCKMAWWVCDFGHEWNLRIYTRKYSNCPVCNESKGEISIRKYLDTKNIKYYSQYRLNYGGKVDFLIFDRNGEIGLEFNGEQHYFPVAFWMVGTNCQKIPSILDALFAGEELIISEPPEIVNKYKSIRDKIKTHYYGKLKRVVA